MAPHNVEFISEPQGQLGFISALAGRFRLCKDFLNDLSRFGTRRFRLEPLAT